MSVNFKALGGLFEFRYTTGDDVDKMNDEELDVVEEEIAKLQIKIDKIRPKGKKNVNPRTAKEILGDEEIPYEVRMKYIIDAYRKDQEKWAKMADYAKHLEGEVIRLKEVLIANGYADSGIVCDSEPDVLKSFCEMPFLGRISPQDAFEGWEEYFEDVALVEIYGFELEDGMVQIAILDYYIMPPEETEG